MFEKPFDFSLFTNSLGGAGLAREADIERRQSERLLPDNTSDHNTQDTYLRSRQSTPDSQQYGSIDELMNQYLDEDCAAGLGNTGLHFNEDDFIRSGRRRRRAARDDEDQLMMAGGLGAEIQQEQGHHGIQQEQGHNGVQQEQGHNSDSPEFNEDDFIIRLHRRRGRTAPDGEDELMMAGGLGAAIQQEQGDEDNERGGLRPLLSALFGQRSEDDGFMAPTQRTDDNGGDESTDSEL